MSKLATKIRQKATATGQKEQTNRKENAPLKELKNEIPR
jgi:hypothetical protein